MLFDENLNRYFGFCVIKSTLYNIFCELSTDVNSFISQFRIMAKMNVVLAIPFASLHLSLTSIMSDLSLTLN